MGLAGCVLQTMPCDDLMGHIVGFTAGVKCCPGLQGKMQSAEMLVKLGADIHALHGQAPLYKDLLPVLLPLPLFLSALSIFPPA